VARPLPPTLFELSHPFDAKTARRQRAAIVAAAKAGGRCLVDVDGAVPLEARVLASLIKTLREVRETEGTMVLAAARPEALETLRLTGLDKVFKVVSPEQARRAARPPADVAPAPKPRRSGTRPRFAAAIGLMVAFSALSGGGVAAEEPSASDLVAHVVQANPSLRSYEARVHVDVHMQSFPFLAPRLDGTTYFKRPDNFEVVFDQVPSYAKGFERLYSDIGDPTSWPRRFNMSVVGDKTVDGHRDLIVRLVQKVRGMIDHQDVEIDPVTWHVDAMEWHYYNGGVISMTQEFADLGGASVLSSQHASIRIPHIRAVAEAHYTDYRTNVAIADSVFTKAAR
jgi:anti-anti-sigma regulatory factor